MERFFKVDVERIYSSELYIAIDLDEVADETNLIKYIELSKKFSKVLDHAVDLTLQSDEWDYGDVEIGTITELYNNEALSYKIYDYDCDDVFDIQDYKDRLNRQDELIVPIKGLKPAKTQMKLNFLD